MRTDRIEILLAAERAELEGARAALLRHTGRGAGTQQSDTGELSGRDEHVADVASETLEREVDTSLLVAIEDELAALAAAERRLAAGTYGHCTACGATLPDDRLEAIPTATRCLAHQEQAEAADRRLRRDVLRGGADLEAAAHLDLLPVDDASSPPAAEDAAVHVRPSR